MRILSTLLTVIALSASLCANAFAAPQLVNVGDKEPVALAKALEDMERSDVIFIGEAHDVKKQHEDQLDIIRALHGKKQQLALGLEMFTTDSQDALDRWSRGELGGAEFQAVYAKNWSYDWQLYRDILIFARDNRIPIIALNVPKQIASKVVRKGSAALDDSDRKQLPPQMSWTLNAPQTAYLQRITRQVFGNKPSPLPFDHFREAQALRNNMMAWQISKFKEKSPKTKVVVIAGVWHAIRNGAPEQLRQYDRGLSHKVILPRLPDLQDVKPEEADYLMH